MRARVEKVDVLGWNKSNKVISNLNSYYYLSTLKDDKEYFITSKIHGADKDRKAQQEIGWKRTYHFKDIV